MQRRKVDLKTSDSGSVDSVTDYEGEVLLHPELARLAEHRERREKLVSIQWMFTTSNKQARSRAVHGLVMSKGLENPRGTRVKVKRVRVRVQIL